MRLKNLIVLMMAIVAMSLLTSCATQIDVAELTGEKPAGFWSGLWHGIIAPFAFFGSLFSDKIAVFDANNTGWWYELGFLLGLGGSGTGTATTVKKGL